MLHHINMNFAPGKIHGIIGRNGSGKTMLMKCICGFIPVTSGKVTVFGKVIGKDVDIPDKGLSSKHLDFFRSMVLIGI